MATLRYRKLFLKEVECDVLAGSSGGRPDPPNIPHYFLSDEGGDPSLKIPSIRVPLNHYADPDRRANWSPLKNEVSYTTLLRCWTRWLSRLENFRDIVSDSASALGVRLNRVWSLRIAFCILRVIDSLWSILLHWFLNYGKARGDC